MLRAMDFKLNFDSSNKKRRSCYNREEEERLEKRVFGDPSDVIKNLKSDTENEAEPTEVEKKPSKNDKLGHTVDTDDSDDDNDKDSVVLMKSDDESIITVDSKVSIKGPAWIDEDDEDISVNKALFEQNRRLPKGRKEKKYSELLKNKFAQIVGTPKWAKLGRDKEESEDSDDEILKHSSHLIPKKTKSLPKGNIDLKVLSNINKQTNIEGPFVNSVQFHETSTVALVAGSSGIVSLFEVDGQENNKLHSVQFQRFQIHTARFLKEGTEILIGSRHHAHCHSYDLLTGKTNRIPLPHGITNMETFEISPDGKTIAICGRLGEIHLLSSNTKEIIGTMKMNDRCRSIAFTPDNSKLITNGDGNEIYTWDVKSRCCINRAIDDGCLSACSVAISPNGQFIAAGSKQGVVNVYEANAVLNEKVPVPVKIVLNFVTAITKLKFNPTSEILAIASNKKVNALKMMHLPSFSVFPNFPTFKTKMSNPLDIDFSPASGYMGLSNNKGCAYLYRLKHYGNY